MINQNIKGKICNKFYTQKGRKFIELTQNCPFQVHIITSVPIQNYCF